MDPARYRRILLALDASPLAETAIPHALAHALAHGAALHVLQVIDPVETRPPVLHDLAERIRRFRQPGEVGAVLKAWEATAAEYLASVAEELRAAGAGAVTTQVLEGSPFDLIGRTAEEAGCDLIVIASHGRSGFGRAMMGSVADHVTRHTRHAAVLVIPAQEGADRR